ncbi:MAG: murein L,D-transpeptidase [Allosphingosinicella sp.]
MACVSLAAMMVAGCDFVSGGSGESVEVSPDKVSPADLQAAVSDERVKRFYAARDWAPVWDDRRAGDLTASFREAVRHGLNPDTFLEGTGKEASPAAREAALTLSAIEYAEALSSGVVDPRKVWEVYTVPMNKVDVLAGLAGAAEAGNVRGWLAGLAPADAEYRALSDAYMRYRQQAGQEQNQPIQPGEGIEQGDSDPRVPQIAEALRRNGYLQPEQPQGEGAADGNAQAEAKQGQANQGQAKQGQASTRYTAEMAAAVKKVQEDYGIKPDGIVGNSTLEALNTGAKERARILAVNLERRRWLERQPSATRIDVNTAAAHLDYYRDGNHRDKRRVVVGQPGWETPQLGSPMFRLVANPPWTVPKSIAEEEILPKGAAYMRSQNMTMKDGWIVQAPGPKAALGQVKFDMQNDHAIYLHDTPAKALFASTDRHASHGCSRVEGAIEFARMLAQDDGKLAEFEKALATGEETPVQLADKIPVRLLYHSAYLDGGKVVFRTDPYGWDDKLAQALGFGVSVRPKVETKHIQDIGP